MKPIYAIKDRAINGFNEPFVQPSEQHMLRLMRDEVNSDPSKSSIAKHPDDYDIYQLGEYDQESGNITAYQAPAMIARCKDLLNPGA